VQARATADQLGGFLGARYGLPDVVDTGQGITTTRFYPEPSPVTPKQLKEVAPSIRGATGADPRRTKVDSGYIHYVSNWETGAGSGEATREILSHVNVMPELRAP
jgi:hypothetical protein